MRGLELRCEGLTKNFGSTRALDRLSLRIAPGSLTALIGPNGAGKTTLLNVVTGYLKPDSGRVFLGSRPLAGLQPHRIASMGVARTFQDVRIVPSLTVHENLLLASEREESLMLSFRSLVNKSSVAKKDTEASALAASFGLAGVIDNRADQVSFGQQKLLALCCAFSTGASILLLDEPVSGVDPIMAEDILGQLRRIQKGRRTVVFVEHDLKAVEELAESVVLMAAGRVIAQGPPREILDQPEPPGGLRWLEISAS